MKITTSYREFFFLQAYLPHIAVFIALMMNCQLGEEFVFF